MVVGMNLSLSLAFALCAAPLFGGWGEYLDPPSGYASFQRRVEKLATYPFPDFDVEEYRQANGPDTFQRLMMAVPKPTNLRKSPLRSVFYAPRTGGLCRSVRADRKW